MPSFDVVSEIDHHELDNAIDQANREVSTRFDFKGSGAKFEYVDQHVTLHAQADFQLHQMLDMLRAKMAKRSIDLECLDVQAPDIQAKTATQAVRIREGLEMEDARFHLEAQMWELDCGGLEAQIRYAVDILDEQRAVWIIGEMSRILKEIGHNPDRRVAALRVPYYSKDSLPNCVCT